MRLAVLGLGPAGAMVALRAAARGWKVEAYDPRGLRQWSATYGLIEHQLPAWLEPFLSPATSMQATDARGKLRPLPFCYRMLDNAAVYHALDRLCAQAQVRISTTAITHASQCKADAVIDCRGANVRSAVWQVAVGWVIAHPPPENQPVFMDWRPSGPYSDDPPSFLYIQRAHGAWLWEETILATADECTDAATRQRLTATLRARLSTRLCALGIDAAAADEEVVFIPMGTVGRPVPGARACGAKAGQINPATGYSVGDTARGVDALLDELDPTQRRASTVQLRRAAQSGVARAQRWLAHALRNVGAQLIVSASGADLRDFFGCFFTLPAADQLAYITGENGVAVARTMWRLRGRVGLGHGFLRPLWTRPWSILPPALLRSSSRRQ
ncbi:Lycopene beta cyclase [Corynebacterium ciconiae DSM 44920]|uniref:lycopene cyclase family protein n=1 Tax=Corynebacterium ciconiae TaxID=227319 RepID=UPI000364314D|nr:lycopene cyclase family protein [Corynebacterium ciconiae]WKD61230.1 Lycopene beta cyclase [Corynebacterium ciconiae DSM 44920]